MKFFLSFLTFLFIFFIAWCGLIFGQVNNPTRMSQWIWDAYEKKQNISKRIYSKKIVVLAGSNALFGVDSKILSNAFKMPVINYGVNAGIELPYILHVAKRVINNNDIVIMPLEYPMYSYDGSAGVQMIDYIFSREASFFWELSLYEQFYMLWHVDIKRIYNGYFYKGGKKIKSGLYGAHHIDENGDQINTEIKFKDKRMTGDVNKHDLNPEKYGEEFDIDSLGWSYIEDFMTWCESKNVKVIFMPSTLLKNESYFHNPKEKWFYENIDNIIREKGWKYTGKPYVYMYDKSLYFNTNFHLINKARKMRTFQMVKDLSPYL